MKKCISLALALLLCGCLLLPVSAESYHGREGLHVILTPGGSFDSNLPGSADHTAALQPGDDITYSVRVLNQYDAQTEWYMKNEILHSLEDRSSVAAGGAYSYRLAYTADSGAEVVLFDSDTVGGAGEHPAGEGLHEVSSALKEYFYFATLMPGQGGTVTLRVALEGESQGNAYQDTLADLQMAFAVAILGGGNGPVDPTAPTNPGDTPVPTQPGSPTDSVTIVKTGDTTWLFPFFLAMGISGLALLGLALCAVVRRHRKRGRFE